MAADQPEDLRVGDTDRQAVAEWLRVALNEGRLDLMEYDERVRGAYAAKTYRQLNELVADLPAVPAPGAGVVAPLAAGVPGRLGGQPPVPTAGATRRWLIATWDDYVASVVICVGIWLAIALTSGGWAGFWPVWVAGPWGAYLAYLTVKGLASGEPQRWAEKQDRKRSAKARHDDPDADEAGEDPAGR